MALIGRAFAVETTVTVKLLAEVVLAAEVVFAGMAVVNKASVVLAGVVASRDVWFAVRGPGADGVGKVVALVKAGTPLVLMDDAKEVAAVEFPAALPVALVTGGVVDRGTGKLAFNAPVTGGSASPIHL